jgi:hypothetical protein
MTKKTHNLKHIRYLTDFEVISNNLLNWKKAKPIKELDDMIDAIISINYYITEIYHNEIYHEEAQAEYRSAKLRAIDRATKAEKKVEELEKELQKYKVKEQLGL